MNEPRPSEHHRFAGFPVALSAADDFRAFERVAGSAAMDRVQAELVTRTSLRAPVQSDELTADLRLRDAIGADMSRAEGPRDSGDVEEQSVTFLRLPTAEPDRL